MDEVEKFKVAIQPYRDGWKSIDVRTVCFLAYGKWVNLATRIILSEKPSEDPIERELLPDFQGFRVFHENRGIDELNSILTQFGRGKLTIGGDEIYFGKIENNDVKTVPPSFSIETYERLGHLTQFAINFPFIAMRGLGESIHNLLSNHPEALGRECLDCKLRSLRVPYDGFDDLLVSFIGVPKPPWGRVIESALIDVMAPIKARLGNKCKLSQGKLDIYIEAIGYEALDDISIGIIGLLGDSAICRRSHTLNKTDWVPVNDRLIAHKEVDVDAGSSIVVFLRFRGNAIHTLKVNDPSALLKNPRILAYSHFDQDLNVLEKYLKGEGKDSAGDFETGVGLLLHFCGFNTGLYGRVIKGGKEEIDIIAFDPSSTNNIIAVECTTKDLDVNNKLSKLSRRVKEISEQLSDFSITPLIFTVLERARISKSDLDKADNEGIGVVAMEELQELLKMAGQQKQLYEILAYLQALVSNRTIFTNLQSIP